MEVSESSVGFASEQVNRDFVAIKRQQFTTFLNCLYDGRLYAQDVTASRWEFALSISEAHELDVREIDLRWMIHRGWIEHSETQRPPVNRIEFSSKSCFIISSLGTELLKGNETVENVREIADEPPSTLRPLWDSERHELTLKGRVIKRFRWPASNQETILSAFEEELWPARIDDPLPQVNAAEPKRRLSDTIKCLNRNQQASLIRFRGDGTGEGVLWDLVGV